MKALSLFLVLAGSAASAAPPTKPMAQALSNPDSAQQPKCDRDDPKAVVVCGHSQQRYRIDPDVLAATRQSEALPPKAPLDANSAAPCTGPNCGGGSYVPLVGMALTALKAAELAADGDDWRDAFRTHPDSYQVYQDTKARRSRISIGVTAGNRRP